jgi:transcription initiation factor IIE alpha subunit
MEDILTKTMVFKSYRCTNCADTILSMMFDNDFINNIMLCPICGEPMDEADDYDRAELYQKTIEHNAEDNVEDSIKDENC